MSILSDIVQNISHAATLEVAAYARSLREQGKDIIDLSLGEPDFETPDEVKKAAYEAIKRNDTRYTSVAGTPALRQAVADKLRRDNGLVYEIENIIVGNGVKQVLYNALSATLNPGDEVIIPAPFWVSYPMMVALAGGNPVIVKTPSSQDFKITPDALEKAITPSTKWLILNSPSNPTGMVYSAEELMALGEVLNATKVYILTDEIYEHLVYGHPFVSFLTVNPQLRNRSLVVNGVSKAYSMTGWRIGYGAGPKEIIASMLKVQAHSTACASSISQAAAKTALTMNQGLLEERCRVFDERRQKVMQWIEKVPYLDANNPQGAFYVYMCCQDLIGKTLPNGKVLRNDKDVSLYFLEKAQVSLVCGAAFGLSPYLRLSYATSLSSLEEALRRMEEALKCL